MDRLYRLSPIVLLALGVFLALVVWPKVKGKVGA